MNIKNNIDHYRSELGDGCTLIAVSKTHPPEIILQAYEAGQRDFGENKVQELVGKYESLPNDIRWHMIGHLQSNKVKYIVPFVHLIHSVDSEKLLLEINKQAAKINRVVSCLLQVHIAREETKFGFSESEVTALLKSPVITQANHIQINGLMGMATNTEDHNQVKNEFRSLHTLWEQLKSSSLPEHVRMRELSMGMSSDYRLAIEEGSTMVRIGSAIFGERNYPEH
ncbi:MAG: YggS family pyridoxal phosphate-dependent enzyme [Cyclobacteriaceae bacterium]|jgi:hypothetical protein|nr:YggS family pyridoxal phosphate-dependent enzyme [Cyclobacteriaceae bacterium]